MAEEIIVQSRIKKYTNLEDLPTEDKTLLQRAEEASKKAYAPYSAYHVGACVLLEDGTTLIGNNQENVAYPSGLCAERVAVFYAGATHPEKRIKSIAIAAFSENFEITEPVFPCGACRQSILEYESKQGEEIRMIIGTSKGPVFAIDGVKSLLPMAFQEENLKKK